jgi:uncharacterized protein
MMINTSPTFHVMAKPTGAQCNLRCDYCFFLKKDQLYPLSAFRMSDETMEQYIRQTLGPCRASEVTVAWQGGEPTLMGLDFFRRAVATERRHAKRGTRVQNTLQTNGTLIDDRWCEFLAEQRFLVGLSCDGPEPLHNAFRHNRAGQPVFDRVVRAVRLLQKHCVEFNILCTVNAANSRYPLEVYRFFRDELGARFIQTIPVVERDNESGNQEGTAVTNRSVRPEAYGRFLIGIFDEWVRRDVGTTFVQFFEGVLASYLHGVSSLCVLQPTCGRGVALEHNGDLYSCDHYVEPRYLLGNIFQTTISDLVSSPQQQAFGQAKSETLPQYCRQCEFLFTCHGECPKNRVLDTPAGEAGLNWLCVGLKAFFSHTEKTMQELAGLLRRGELAEKIMYQGASESAKNQRAKVGRNHPCPCGSRQKYKRCHGRPRQDRV